MKIDKSSIIDIVVMGLITAFLLSDVSRDIPYFDLGLPILWIFFILHDIYKKRRYLSNKPEYEIRISSNNDSYFSALPFIAGFIVCVVSLFILLHNGHGKQFGNCLFHFGIGIGISGFTNYPVCFN